MVHQSPLAQRARNPFPMGVFGNCPYGHGGKGFHALFRLFTPDYSTGTTGVQTFAF
jgi:hypothetical protein